MAGTAPLSGQLDLLAPSERDQYVRLALGDGWIAHVAVGDSRHETRYGTNGTALTQDQWLKWLRSPLQWARQAQRQDLLKTSATTTVCRVHLPLDDGRHVEVVCKHRRSRQFFKRLLNAFRISRPMRTWRRACILLNCHIPTARPLAIVEQRRFGLLMDSLILTEYLRGVSDLEGLLTVQMRGLDNHQAYQVKSRIGDALARFLVRLRSSGLVHRDLKALNVIIQWDRESPQPPRICLVDLDGVKRTLWPYGRGWMRMLMRLNVSVDSFRRVNLTDRLRLLKRFMRRSGLTAPWKQVWRELAVASDRKREIQTRHQELAFRKYGRF